MAADSIRPGSGSSAGTTDDQHAVGLPQHAARPWRPLGIGLENDEAMLALLRGEPRDDRLVDDVVVGALGDPALREQAIDIGARELQHGSVGSQRVGEAR